MSLQPTWSHAPTPAVADLADVRDRAAEALADGSHVADGDELWAAVARIDERVLGHLANGTTVSAAYAAISVEVTDRLAMRVLQGRAVGDVLLDYAVLIALDGYAWPSRWWLAERH